MPKELSKCREWEKERRNRLNEAFSTLCKLLPCYDPSITTSKLDILKNASAYIEELQAKNKTLLSDVNDEKAKKIKGDELKKLQERLKKLLLKNEHLCRLLRDAKITIPSECVFVKKFPKSHLPWSQRLTQEQANILQKKEAEKENLESGKKTVAKRNKTKVTAAPKHRKAILNRPDTKKNKSTKRKKNTKPLSPSKCVIVLSQPSISQSCYVITNAPSHNIIGNTSTVITNSALLSNPLMSANTKSTAATPQKILGPGTLILANGTLMPVLPQQTVLPIITRPQNQTVILLPPNPVNNSNSIANSSVTTDASTVASSNKIVTTTTTSSSKALVKIKPKFCLTRTTQVNKVPIPALTSRYANNDLVKTVKVNNKSETSNNHDNTNSKKNSSKEKNKTGEITENNQISSAKKAESSEKRKSDDSKADNNNQPNDAKKSKTSDVNELKTTELPPQEQTPIQNDKIPEKVTETQNKDTTNPDAETKSVKSPIHNDTNDASKKIDDNPAQLDLNINSELSNDIFASLQVPAGCQNPESTSPTAAFLLAFPLVSSLTGVKVTEVTEEDNNDSQSGTPTLLQIGTMDTTKPTQSQSDSLTPSLLNLDNLSFFSSKDINGFYNNFDATTTTAPSVIATNNKETISVNSCYNDQITYQVKSSDKLGVKSADDKQSCPNYNAQKPFYNETSTNNTNNNNNNNNNNSTSLVKNYPDPLYTNSNTYNYNYHSSDNLSQQNYYKTANKTDNNRSNYYSLSYENYSDYKKNDSSSNSVNYYNNTANYSKVNSNVKSVKNNAQRPLINWMTTPDSRLNPLDTDFTHHHPNSFYSNTQTTYFNTNSVYSSSTSNINTQDSSSRKTLDLPLVNSCYQDENQFSWSPTKIPQFLDPPHSFVSSTLPTLVGDLALGNPLSFDQKIEKSNVNSNNAKRRVKYDNSSSNNNTNQPNFLSVSQLVEQCKSSDIRNRRNNNNSNRNSNSNKKITQKSSQRSSKEVSSNKIDNSKNLMRYCSSSSGGGGNSNEIFSDKRIQQPKTNYSAEALIGHHMNQAGSSISNNSNKQNYSNKSLAVPPFLSDNIIPYFTPVADDNYMQQNHNFGSTFQNNTYSSGNNFMTCATGTTMTSSSYNFIHDITNNDYTSDLNLFPLTTTKDKNCSNKNYGNININKALNNNAISKEHNQIFHNSANNNSNNNNNLTINNQQKKSKRAKTAPSESNNLPNFDFPLFSMPSSINSPILPDDFHSANFPQLYPCKNSLYPAKHQNDMAMLPLPPPVPSVGSNSSARINGSSSVIAHPDISPSINNAAPSTLTNFNLSTIFPEINNKSAPIDTYSEQRVKENSVRSCYSSAVQVSFNEKPIFSFSYINCPTTQSYNNHQ